MSKLIVEVCRVDDIEDHPNADKMKIATIKGWKTCVRYFPETGKAEFAVGDKCIYFPPDSILPPAICHAPDDPIPGRLNNLKYLKTLPKNADGSRPVGGRVAAARLRGTASYGVIMAINPEIDPDWEIGTDVTEHFGITKWEPPLECVDGDAAKPHVRFYRYTSIENYGNYPNAFVDGQEVVMTEKIHGMNSRMGLVLSENEEGNASWEPMAGSHSVQRKQFDSNGKVSQFWEVLTPNVSALFDKVLTMNWDEPLFSIMLYGEILGVQDMKYGFVNGQRGYRAFDISVNDKYLDFELKQSLFEEFGIEKVPVLYRGPFSKEVVEKHTSGDTTVCDLDKAGSFKGREGVVITPVKEQFSNVLGGRLILKSISADYLARRNATDSH